MMEKPLVSIILPAFNEQALIERNTNLLFSYLDSLEDRFLFEVILINDGSKDETGKLADQLAGQHDRLQVYHHQVNRNLGNTLRTGFAKSNGDYVVVLDLDLSYNLEHIEALLSEIQTTDAEIVIASPYMAGGKNTAVPRLRLLLSKSINYIMRKISKLKVYTFTGMVRAYKGDFIRNLNTKSSTFDINPEILFKAYILRARILEIPAHLDWTEQNKLGDSRTSGVRIFKGILNGLANSFMFRPYAFFWTLGLLILLLSLYILVWIFINTYMAFPHTLQFTTGFEERLGMAVSQVFRDRPYSFIVGGVTLIIAIQLLSLGFVSLQQKRYFDELFHLNSKIKETLSAKDNKIKSTNIKS